MVGNENWDAMQYEVVQAGSDSWKGTVYVWNRESGSHGRKSEGAAAGDWKEGDTITLQTCIEKGKDLHLQYNRYHRISSKALKILNLWNLTRI